MTQTGAYLRFKVLPALWPSLLATTLTLAVTFILVLLREGVNPYIVALLYLAPVGLGTLLWGLGAGIVAAVGAFLEFNYFFIQPHYSLRVRHVQDLIGLLVFLGVAVVISQLLGRARKNLSEAQAREKDAHRLFELSTELAGLHDSDLTTNEIHIAKTIAQRTLETFQAEQVVIALESKAGQKPALVKALPNQPTRPPRSKANLSPDLLIPLQTAGHFLGEIRIWRSRQPFTPAEERLARTFANQGMLSLERARLLQAETRTRVLEESDQLKSALLSSVSHELRTPLSTIKAAVTSLRSEAVEWDSPARNELLAAIEEDTDHLNQLVGNLLNMSRIEAGALKPTLEWNELREIVSGVVVKGMRRGDPGEHKFQVNIPDDFPLVRVDYVLLEQVFINLISNSIKYSPPNTVIHIVAQGVNEKWFQVELTNQGPEVPEEHLKRIFEKFNRLTASKQITGTGLGLSICKGIIEAHGGSIWARNLTGGEGTGLVFVFTLPIDALNNRLPIPPSEMDQGGKD